MLSTHAANVIPVSAIFNLSKNGIAQLEMPEQINTPHGINQIMIDLATEGLEGARAIFAPDPPGAVIWLDASGRVIAPPPAFQVVRTDHQIILWDANATSFETTHRFWLLVQYQGRTYYKDPTIINQKPGQP